MRSYLLIMQTVRRKIGSLVRLELDICRGAIKLRANGDPEFHGYVMAKHLAGAGRSSLAAYGTLYRALARLEDMGLLKSRWEDPEIPQRENRPPRRLYSLTALGEAVTRDNAVDLRPALSRRLRGKWAPA
jgi:PadR family transcriptional regulator, regulatory protein PadR